VRQPHAEDAEKYRSAQAHRIIRFCRENGLDSMSELSDNELAPILNDAGKVIPEQVDFDATS
jgi:hypothetical protein